MEVSTTDILHLQIHVLRIYLVGQILSMNKRMKPSRRKPMCVFCFVFHEILLSTTWAVKKKLPLRLLVNKLRKLTSTHPICRLSAQKRIGK